MKILVVSNNYPSLEEPNRGAFVYNLIKELAKHNDITVVAPRPVHDTLKKKTSECYGAESWEVLRPRYFSFSNKNILGIRTIIFTRYFEKRAVVGAIRKIKNQPDIIYCHFLVNSLSVLDYAKKHDVPLVVASGESSYEQWEKHPISVRDKAKEAIRHIICVSDNNKSQLIALGFDKDKITVIPNAVDHAVFKPMDKTRCKEKLGVHPDKFVVGFVGHYIERKGPNRVIEAIRRLKDEDIKLVCVGKGDRLIKNDFTVEFPPMEHHRMPEVFNAFDVFVLPTLTEGHCNAIEEAKACGVPVISSKGTSVEAQLSEKCGILVDPQDVGAISCAIAELKSNRELLRSYCNNLISSPKNFSIRERARKINELLERLMSQRY